MSNPAGPRSRTVPIVRLTVLLVVATLIGAWRVSASAAFQSSPDSLSLGHATVRVTHVERVTGLTESDLAGMAHGISGLVREDHALIRVSVAVSAGSRLTSFDTSGLRIFAGQHAVGRPPIGGSVGHGRLHARASIEGALSFVVPRNGAALSLGSISSSRRVPLLHVGTAPAGADHSGMHMGSGSPSTSRSGH